MFPIKVSGVGPTISQRLVSSISTGTSQALTRPPVPMTALLVVSVHRNNFPGRPILQVCSWAEGRALTPVLPPSTAATRASRRHSGESVALSTPPAYGNALAMLNTPGGKPRGVIVADEETSRKRPTIASTRPPTAAIRPAFQMLHMKPNTHTGRLPGQSIARGSPSTRGYVSIRSD